MRLNGQNALILGMPGSGKTTLAPAMYRIRPHAISIDPLAEFDENPVEGFTQGARAIWETRDEPVHLAIAPTVEPQVEVEHLLIVAEHAQRQAIADGRAMPLAIFLDEASAVTDTFEILPQLRRIYNMGRRWGICLCVIAQVDTDIHRLTRRNSQLIVAMQQQYLSTDLRRIIPDARVPDLQVLTPGDRPQNGRHYVTAPPGVDVLQWWLQRVSP